MSVCVVNISLRSVSSVDVQAAMVFNKTKKKPDEGCCANSTISKLPQECFLKDDQNVLKRNKLHGGISY